MFGPGETSAIASRSPIRRAGTAGRDRDHGGALASHLPQRQRSVSPSPHAGRPRRREQEYDIEHRRRMPRNRSMVDMRSQLLHRTLVEELNRRLFFNTVAPVENIGFRAPAYSAAAARGRVNHRGRRCRDDDNKHHQYIML